MHPNALPDFAGLATDDPNCGGLSLRASAASLGAQLPSLRLVAVVVGLAKENFSYSNMNRAFRILLQPGTNQFYVIDSCGQLCHGASVPLPMQTPS